VTFVSPKGSRTFAGIIVKLTPRERQVVELFLTGADNKLIAKKLGITVRTVKVHFEHMYRKNGITGGSLRAKLAVMAYRESEKPCQKRNGNKLIQEGAAARYFEKGFHDSGETGEPYFRNPKEGTTGS
jgi:DNA-binding CsgD family transcriptional regulator